MRERSCSFTPVASRSTGAGTALKLKTMRLSVALSSPGSSKAELALTTGGSAKNEVASLALDGRLCVRENGVDGHALRALNIHEVGVR